MLLLLLLFLLLLMAEVYILQKEQVYFPIFYLAHATMQT